MMSVELILFWLIQFDVTAFVLPELLSFRFIVEDGRIKNKKSQPISWCFGCMGILLTVAIESCDFFTCFVMSLQSLHRLDINWQLVQQKYPLLVVSDVSQIIKFKLKFFPLVTEKLIRLSPSPSPNHLEKRFHEQLSCKALYKND